MSTHLPKLYLINLGKEMSLSERERHLPFIPVEKAKRLSAFRHWQDAQRTLLGYSMLSYLLTKETGLPREKFNWTFDYYGKPQIPGMTLKFNLSHAGEWIACAIGEDVIGVDVEQIQPIDLSIANHFFNQLEVADLTACTPAKQPEYFFTLWTLKESYIKAEGQGVSIPLHSFWFRFGSEGEILFDSVKHETKWRFQLYEFSLDYKLAVCVDGGNLPTQVEFLTREEIG